MLTFFCWDSFEDIYKLYANIDVMCLAVVEERVDDGCSDRCIGKHPIKNPL